MGPGGWKGELGENRAKHTLGGLLVFKWPPNGRNYDPLAVDSGAPSGGLKEEFSSVTRKVRHVSTSPMLFSIEGKALKLYWSWDGVDGRVNWERMGQSIL